MGYRYGRLLLKVCLLLLAIGSQAQELKVVSFSSPPLIGATRLSPEGITVEMVKAMAQTQGVTVDVQIMPRARSTGMFESGEASLMIGPLETLKPEVQKVSLAVPLCAVPLILFYKKSKFPQFSFQDYGELKKYSIGCVIGSAPEKFLKEQGVKVDSAPNIDLLMKKLEADRNDFAVIVDINGKLLIQDGFPANPADIAYYEDKPITVTKVYLLVKKSVLGSEQWMKTFSLGLKNIWQSGKWKSIMEKYYGPGKVPRISMDLVKDFVEKM